MSRLIDADLLEPDADYDDGEYWAVSMVQIQNAPTIEPKRKGKWLPDNTNYITPHFVCSACGMSQKVETVMYKPIWAFCPRCGARMMEGEQE